MRWQWALILGGLGMALAAPSSAQRQALPYGLRGGRHAVAVRAGGGWQPVGPDSGPAQVLVLTDARPVGPDSATALYLASHGYVVVYGAAESPDAGPGARIELHPAGALVRITVAGQRLTVAIPPGSGDRIRLRATVALATLDSALRLSPPALAELIHRLRAAGLVVDAAPAEGQGRRPS